MAAKFYSTSDLSRKSGDIIAEALQRPVTITQRNKPRLVVMNVDQYEDLRKRADSRRAVTLEELAEIVTVDEMNAALAKYLAEGDDE